MDEVLAGVDAADASRLRQVGCLAGARRVTSLEGGITNRNYRVDLDDHSVVVRLSDPQGSDLAIDRENEYLNSVAAAASGAAPAVIEYQPGAGALVVAWVRGRTFTEADVRSPANLPRIAQACRILHAGPAFAQSFDMFDIQARYLALVRERGYRLPDRYEEFAPQVARVRAAMQGVRERLVPCNNDLLAANLIDDGERIWIIDYEYSGMNEASFEIGNIWSESTLPLDQLEPLVEAYWGQATPARIARARLWALMSKYGWTLWASIQQATSSIDFDYWSWGMEKYERAVAEFDSMDFDSWLDAVGTAEATGSASSGDLPGNPA
ncbi:MAG: phosphotransferase [Actinomycetales bacterium]|nr:phosphotransferase [Actinomycetales bacterium]